MPKIAEEPFLVVFSAVSAVSAIFLEKSPGPQKLERHFEKIQDQAQPNNSGKRFRKTAEETFPVLFSAISATVKNRRRAISSGILGGFGDLGDFLAKVFRASETGPTFRENSRANSSRQHCKTIPENRRRAISSGVLGDLGDCQKSPRSHF